MITVGIPTIGRVETLPTVLFSILQQKEVTISEVILLDEADGVTLAHYPVAQMLDLLSLKGVKVKIIRNRNRIGIGSARVWLAEETKTELLLMVDDDVVLRDDLTRKLGMPLINSNKYQWSVGTCLLVNKALGADMYIDSVIERKDPRIKEFTEKYPWFIPYFRYSEEFVEEIVASGTQAIMFKNARDILAHRDTLEKLGTLPREDTILTRLMGPGLFISGTECYHIEDLVQKRDWSSSMFYKLHLAAIRCPKEFADLIGGLNANNDSNTNKGSASISGGLAQLARVPELK